MTSAPELQIEILQWLGASSEDPLERETFASLRIVAGPEATPLTEVEDYSAAHSVRDHINVPAYALARWLLVNWWRLRWEPARSSTAWLHSHSLAAIGGGFAWPALTFASDGESIRLDLDAENAPDVAAVRYLRSISTDISASDFERGVSRFLDTVGARVAARCPGERELFELREELEEEQRTPGLAELCKLQAMAGIDPGDASEDWLRAVRALMDREGPVAIEEALAALESDLDAAKATLEAIRHAKTTIKFDPMVGEHSERRPEEVPWQWGARLARDLRNRLGKPSGPLENEVLEQVLDTKLPLEVTYALPSRQLRGSYRNGHPGGRATLLMTKSLETGQRFELARVIGAAMVSQPGQKVLPVSDAKTALQKFERSFAQELLCPWKDLAEFTDERGTDETAIEAAAEHFKVSELLIESTLVNKRKVPRWRLAE